MMLAGTELQVLVATRPVDFRKQADTLAALVQGGARRRSLSRARSTCSAPSGPIA